ncbi:D-arabinono-1,4-lactone oxidase [Spirochaeta africana]|uniref:FAD/FMN-dependent dehydrogenase n=1 Tax=Spirochaeta africana (strain ATCC 700263 / DSM 8902 / Z-7692) TaxID=889378 RepID=H9UFQ8_SPIAZ|nr:D-arabinono-1,4-lactone oxidase [Spirochaeta africana]AFG36351.1 FAD/FMN-dependent dehydrogenase [Spirochaeta africana DSM 8902]
MHDHTRAGQEWISWNGNVRHRYARMHQPASESELVDAVRDSSVVRPFGNKQSSADIAAGTPDLVSLDRYDRIVAIDHERREITAESGIRLADLLRRIDELGWSLSALPDIDTITLGGAIATATHGTAAAGRILSDHMVRCRLVTADGTVREFTEDDPEMPALRVSLGVLGVFSTITLRCDLPFHLALTERPVRDRDWSQMIPHLLDRHPFVRVLYLPHTGYGYLITGDRSDTPPRGRTAPWWVKYRRAVSARLYRRTVRHPKFTVFANRLIKRLFFSHTQTGFGTLYEATVTKSRGSTLELAEWSVALEDFPALFAELSAALNDRKNPAFAHIPMDVRFLQADTSWLSYAYQRDCVTVGCVTRTPEHADEYAAFEVVEDIFRRHGGRPHWAKRHRMRGEDFAAVYPRWADFCSLRRRMDPHGKFLNPYLRRLFGEESSFDAPS